MFSLNKYIFYKIFLSHIIDSHIDDFFFFTRKTFRLGKNGK